MTSFLQKNQQRAYPLIDSDAALAIAGVLTDLRITIWKPLVWDTVLDRVRLVGVVASGAGTELLFDATTGGLTRLRVLVPLDASAYSQHLAGDADWQVELTIGEAEALIQHQGVFSLPVEPACVVELGNAMSDIGSNGGSGGPGVRVWNRRRTIATVRPNCDALGVPPMDDLLAGCILADLPLRVAGGHNTVVQAGPSGVVTVATDTLGGELGPLCTPMTLYPGEAAPDGRTTLDGGQSCPEVIRSVNGISVSDLRILAGPGIEVIPIPDEAAVLIRPNRSRFVDCGQDPDATTLARLQSIQSAQPGPAVGVYDAVQSFGIQVKAVCGKVTYRRQEGTQWTTDDPLDDNCVAYEPRVNFGTEMLVETRPEASESNWVLRNHDFFLGLSKWRSQGNVQVLRELAGYTIEELPICYMQGSSAIWQRKLKATGGAYVLSLLLHVQTGTLNVLIATDAGKPLLSHAFEVTDTRRDILVPVRLTGALFTVVLWSEQSGTRAHVGHVKLLRAGD